MTTKSASKFQLVEALLDVDTGGAYADKDVLAAQFAVKLEDITGKQGAKLINLIVCDIDAIAALAFDLMFFSAALTSVPALNAAIAQTDAEWKTCLGVVSVAAADFVAYEDVKIATRTNLSLILPRNFWVLPVARSASTFVTAADVLKLTMGFESVA